MSAGDSTQAGERLIPYRPGLDGLRGLSVAAVLAFHSGFSWAVGGYLGVSVFFTLSGFLITSLLLAEHERTGRIDLRHFWGRRFRRLLPASLLALAGIAVFGLTVATADQADRLGGDIAAAVAYVANWRFIFGDTSYATLFAEPTPVLHFWSLAIEEQFYLLYPPLMVAILALARGRRLVVGGVLGGLFLASAATSLLLGTGDLDRIYFGTDTRAAELLAGAVLAVALLWWSERIGRRAGAMFAISGAVAVALLGAAMVTIDGDTLWLYQGGFAGIALLSCLAILGATRDGPVASLLGVAPLRWLGTRSYGIYLYHWPIFLWLDAPAVGRDGVTLVAIRLAVTLAVSELSYRLVETPIRYRRPLPRPMFAMVPGGIAVVVALGLYATATAPAPAVDLSQSVDRLPPPPVTAPVTVTSGPMILDPTADVVVIGDGLATEIAEELADALGRRLGWNVADLTDPDCPLAALDTEECADLADIWRIATDDAELVVVSFGPGSAATPGRLPGPTIDLATQFSTVHEAIAHVPTVVLATQPLILDPGDEPALTIDPTQTAWPVQAEINAALVAHAESSGERVIDLARYLRFSEENAGTGASILDHGDDRITIGLGWVADQILEVVGDPTPVDVDAVRILVVGDSVAYSLGRGLEPWANERGDVAVWNVGATGCGILREGTIPDTEIQPSPVCAAWPERFQSHLDEFAPDVVVMISTGWDLLERRLPGWGTFLGPGDPHFDAYMLSEYHAAVEVLSSTGAPVAWATTPCVSPARAAAGSVFEPSRTASQNVVVHILAAHDERVALIDLDAIVCPGGTFTNEVDDIDDFRPDGVHFSDEGSLWVAEQIGPQLLELASATG